MSNLKTITSEATGCKFSYDASISQAITRAVGPLLDGTPPKERMVACALLIAFACWEENGDCHAAFDALTAEMAGSMVQQVVSAAFKANRNPQQGSEEELQEDD